MGWLDRLSEGLARTRDSFKESMNVVLDRGPALDDEFWEELEASLVMSDMGAVAAADVVANLQYDSSRKGLSSAYEVMDMLAEKIAEQFVPAEHDPFRELPSLVLFVGINGAGKTTTVGKIANDCVAHDAKVLIGSADTFRAAAIEQLDVWGQRAGVEVVKRERGADPASVCYDVIERAEQTGSNLVLIDTSGRLHTSSDLMRELEKVVSVTKKRSTIPVHTVLVMDATTGQNGINQAEEFDKALDLDGLIVTKLDGTAKGGVAIAASRAINVPILRIGVGESIDDLKPFDALEYSKALIGQE